VGEESTGSFIPKSWSFYFGFEVVRIGVKEIVSCDMGGFCDFIG
jgi:hypothetical protein